MDGNFFSVIANAFNEARNSYNQARTSASLRNKEAQDNYRWGQTFKLQNDRLAQETKRFEDEQNYKKFKMITDTFQNYQENQNKLNNEKAIEGLKHTNRLDEIKAGRVETDPKDLAFSRLSPDEQKEYWLGKGTIKQQPSYSDVQQDAGKFQTANVNRLFTEAFSKIPSDKRPFELTDSNAPSPGSLKSFIAIRDAFSNVPSEYQNTFKSKVDSGVVAHSMTPKDLLDAWGNQKQGNNPEDQWGRSNIDDWDTLDSTTKQKIISKAKSKGELR